MIPVVFIFFYKSETDLIIATQHLVLVVLVLLLVGASLFKKFSVVSNQTGMKFDRIGLRRLLMESDF